MPHIFVTGAGGYIGCHVVEFLCNKNFQVTACDLKPDRIDPRARFVQMNILEPVDCTRLFASVGKPDALIHLAWQDGFNHKALSHLTNLSHHYTFLTEMMNHGVQSISVMGSMHEVGYHEGAVTADTPCRPLSLYGVAKNALRQACLSYTEGQPVSFKWLRAFYITGDDRQNQSVFSKILQAAAEGKTTFPFTTGESKYDFLDVHSLAEQIASASLQTKINGIINCCSGVPVSLKDKAETFIAQNHLNIRLEYGVFPARKYDSPAIWGDATLIRQIMQQEDTL